ncbi:MAG: S-layer homology domain-containing protein [Clostridia bacterium]
MRKTLGVILAFALLFSMFGPAAVAAAPPYSDINGHWAEDMILDFHERGYLTGYEDGTFRPEAFITRAEAAVFVARLGFPEIYESIPYSDLMPGKWYHGSVVSATMTGFMHGYPDNTFRPENYILREEAAKLASLFWGEVDLTGFALGYTDAAQISGWALEHVKKLVKLDTINDYPDNTIRPRIHLTRAEFVKLFYTYLFGDAKVTVRAVDANDPARDLAAPAVHMVPKGSTVQYTAPAVPQGWEVKGSVFQTVTVNGDMEVVFEYEYLYDPVTLYEVTLILDMVTFDNHLDELDAYPLPIIEGSGLYAVGSQVTISTYQSMPVSFEVWYPYVFQGWYLSLYQYELIDLGIPRDLFCMDAQCTFTMPAYDLVVYARYFPEYIYR